MVIVIDYGKCRIRSASRWTRLESFVCDELAGGGLQDDATDAVSHSAYLHSPDFQGSPRVSSIQTVPCPLAVARRGSSKNRPGGGVSEQQLPAQLPETTRAMRRRRLRPQLPTLFFLFYVLYFVTIEQHSRVPIYSTQKWWLLVS